jgi:hypothetical protein
MQLRSMHARVSRRRERRSHSCLWAQTGEFHFTVFERLQAADCSSRKYAIVRTVNSLVNNPSQLHSNDHGHNSARVYHRRAWPALLVRGISL